MPNYQDLNDPDALPFQPTPGGVRGQVLDALANPDLQAGLDTAGAVASVPLAPFMAPYKALSGAFEPGPPGQTSLGQRAAGAAGGALDWLGGAFNNDAVKTMASFAKRYGPAPGVTAPAAAPVATPAAAGAGAASKASAGASRSSSTSSSSAQRSSAPAATGPAAPAGVDPLDELEGHQQSTLDAEASTRAAAAEDIAKAQAEGVQRLEVAHETYKKTVDDGLAEQTARQADVDAAIDDAKNTKIDPEEWSKSRSGGQQIATIVGMALGALGEGLGGVNVAGKMIGDAIKRNVDAQMANQAQKNATVGQKQSAFGHFLTVLGDRKQAALAAEEWVSKQTLQKIDSITANSQSPLIQAAALKAKTEITQNMMGLRANRVKLARDVIKQDADIAATKATTAASYAQARHANAESKGLELQNTMRQRAVDNGDLLPEYRDRAVVLPGGKVVLLNRKESAEKLTPMVGSAGALLDEVDNAIGLVKTWGSSSDKTAAGNSLGIAIDSIVKNINQAEGINQGLQAEQIQMYKHALEKGTFKPDAATIAAFETLAHSVKRNVNKQIEAAGGGKNAGFAEAPRSLKPGAAK